jgi:hypothetical protein
MSLIVIGRMLGSAASAAKAGRLSGSIVNSGKMPASGKSRGRHKSDQ